MPNSRPLLTPTLTAALLLVGVLVMNSQWASKATQTTFVIAAGNGDVNHVIHALDAGIDPNSYSDFGWTALASSLASSDREISTILIDRGADVNRVTRDGDGALVPIAIRSGSVLMARFVIKRGAHPCPAVSTKIGNDFSATSIVELAAVNGHRALADYLEALCGAQPSTL